MNPAFFALPSLILALPFAVEVALSAPIVEAPTQESPNFGLHPEFDLVIRGQSPQTYDLGPGTQTQIAPQFDPNMGSYPNSGQIYGGQPVPQGYDPFMASPYAGATGDPMAGQFGYGVVGPQPVRLGWSTHFDFAWLGEADLQQGPVAGQQGSLTQYEYNFRFDNITMAPNGWTWKQSPEINYTEMNFKNIEASQLADPVVAPPAGVPVAIADNYYRLGYRLETTSPQYGLASWRLGFTPSINSDFERQLNSKAWNFDADVTSYIRTSPNLMFVAGVLYWDRAEDIILPNAGVVWNPNEFWEIRATFPKSRAEVFVGTPFGLATWMYMGAEYDVQSWQAGEISGNAQLQTEEWRAFAGFRWESCAWESYLDFGYAFDREYSVHGLSSVVPLDPGETFMIRYGMSY
ncbi:hypothetical protein [Rubinisphaera italica]|uniref:Uncharacterized protein n=1 Tax=Rubinisphaera italica TaxID=2527969 RepID=A0A5C5XK01_9PLAN|nr:hypothetical protein [Rubinisphaera italica]TWT62122.1 hypothetical protein Pan54_28610 [Rubinisphaera italica]